MSRSKHYVVGAILIVILLVVALLLLWSYQKSLHHPYWQLYRSPPVALLNELQLEERQARAVKKIDGLLSKNFQGKLKNDVVLSAWLIRGPSFSTKKAAKSALLQIQALGLDSFIQPLTQQGLSNYHVYLGPFTQQQDAMKALKLMRERLKMIGVLQHYSVSAKD